MKCCCLTRLLVSACLQIVVTNVRTSETMDHAYSLAWI